MHCVVEDTIEVVEQTTGQRSKMHCVVNKDGIVVALFLLESDAQDFIDKCGPLTVEKTAL